MADQYHKGKIPEKRKLIKLNELSNDPRKRVLYIYGQFVVVLEVNSAKIIPIIIC